MAHESHVSQRSGRIRAAAAHLLDQPLQPLQLRINRLERASHRRVKRHDLAQLALLKGKVDPNAVWAQDVVNEMTARARKLALP